jgi:hypothetical protein
MTYGFDTPIDFIPLERGRLSRRNPFFSQIAPGALILTLGALFGYWTLYVRPAPAPKIAKAPTVAAPVTVASNPYGALSDPRASSGSTPPSASSGSTSALLTQNFPLEASLEPNPPANVASAEPENVTQTTPESAESAPLPVPRPADLGPPESRGPAQDQSRRLAQQNARTVPTTATADNRSFFDKLFAMVQPSTASAPSAPSRQALAYAAPEDGSVGPVQRLTAPPPARAAGGTAIYDVAAHTVYMPDGTRLEAHSGLGQLKDDPRYVSERMRGPTPPSTYDLSVREQLFHGVKALRLTPVGGGGVYGRTGLLAHRYMLGPNGDSNGCVSFRDYNAFLQAYERGQVQRLVVVARAN